MCRVGLILLLAATSARAGATFDMQIAAATDAPDDLHVTVNLASTYQLAGPPRAQVLTSSAILDPIAGVPNQFTGHLSLVGLPLGTLSVAITAQDVLGNTGSGSVTFLHGHPPVLTLRAGQTVARPELRIAADCVDDQGACTIAVRYIQYALGGTNVDLASGTGHVDTCVSLDAYAGQEGDLIFTASDTVGLSSSLRLPVTIETSPHVATSETVPGRVFDLDASRLLWGNEDGTTVTLRDRSSGTDQVIYSSTSLLTKVGILQLGYADQFQFLTQKLDDAGAALLVAPAGLILPTLPPFHTALLTRNQSGLSTVLQGDVLSFLENGHFALAASTAGSTLVDLASATATALPVTASSEASPSLGADGIVAYQDKVTHHVILWQAGATTDLGPGSAPVTDGVDTIWSVNPSTLQLRDGSGNVAQIANATGPYLVAGGWAAFTRSQNGPSQVWVRSPAGVETQIGPYASAKLETLDASGDVTLCYSGSTRAMSIGGGAPSDVSSCLGTAKWISPGKLQLAMAGAILQPAAVRETPACVVGASASASDSNAPRKGGGCSSAEASGLFAGIAALLLVRRVRR